MNKLNSDALRPPEAPQYGSDDEIDLRKLFAVIRRNLWTLVLGGAVGLTLAIAQLSTTTRLYTSSLDLSIGRSADAELFQDLSGVTSARTTEMEIETVQHVLRSERIAERVVRTLNLQDNSTFNAPVQSGFGRLTGTLRSQISQMIASTRALLSEDIPELSDPDPSRADQEMRAIDRAVGRLRSNMSVSASRGRVIQIRYTSASPALSERIANAIAQAYIQDELESTDEASQRAITWLRERRDQLREQSDRVSAIAERFREENDLMGVDVDRLGDAEFERLTQNLVAARAELVELEAASRRLDEIVESGDTSAVVRETAGQGITSGLRSRYLETLRQYNNLAGTLGDDHAQTQRRFRELQEIETLMFEEVRRSAELIRDDIRAARERVAGFEEAQSRAGERVGADQAVLSELRELERNAETVRNLYIGFQTRYEEATQRQEIPVSNARVLNRAQGASQTSPNAPRTLALGGLLGFLFAGGFVAWREWRDDRVRSEEQVREELGLEYLGGLTVLKGVAEKVPEHVEIALSDSPRTVAMPEILTFAASKPLSNYAETLRTGKMSLSLRHGKTPRAPRIGFVSCVPAEGKTTTAGNFATLLAQQGASVMLIDGDMRNPGLSRSLNTDIEFGLVDVLMGEKDWRDVGYTVEGTGLDILPNSKARVAHTAELMGSNNMHALLDALDSNYDYVILDLPPLAPVVDARAVLDQLDGVFFVLKWGETNIDIAKRVLRMDPRLRDKCYGAFLNLFDPKKARAYTGYEGYRHYRSYYNRYYRDS